MQTRTVEQVESWNARPFSGGIRELHDLADDEFSGAVVADDSWAFFLNGRVIGVFQGDIETIAGTEGQIYTAPHQSLPLLFTMQERGGKTKAKYFTNDTTVEEADRTLRDANFTGYLELSENVLSGDYYVSYYGGRSMSAAFVGQSERLITGDEAFEKANDEVGVYEVRTVSMEIVHLPPIPEEDSSEPQDASATPVPTEDEGETSSATGDEATADEEATPTRPESPTAAESEQGDGPDDQPVTVEDAESGADVSATNTDTETDTTQPSVADDQTADEPTEGRGTVGPRASNETDESPASDSDADRQSESSVPSQHERAVREWGARGESSDDEDDDLFREEAQWRETKSIPALDPDESENPGEKQREEGPSRKSSPSKSSTPEVTDSSPSGQSSTKRSTRETTDPSATGQSRSGRLSKLKSAIAERDERIEALEAELSDEKSSKADLEETVASLREERSALEKRVESLESNLEASSSGPVDDDSPTSLSPDDAFAGTNLFVRYDSKGQATLDAVADGSVDAEAVNENLRLDHHTKFEASETTVDGTDYETFLHDSSRYQFVDWMVRELPYELQDTGARSALQDVYEAIPRFDRIEFAGTVDVSTEDGSTTREFDVVIRDRMGDPLVVADLNETRDPVRTDAMNRLVSGAGDVGDASESLAGAFYVTASYFEPGALETATEAADEGGFFSRSDKQSYVKVSRNRGFHLCLVEDRRDAFHLTVPEL